MNILFFPKKLELSLILVSLYFYFKNIISYTNVYKKVKNNYKMMKKSILINQYIVYRQELFVT